MTARIGRPPRDEATRAFVFWANVAPADSGCWEWNGTRAQFGYGRTMVSGREQMAHRVAYEMGNGPIPDDLCVLHKCDNPPCINPSHLFLGTKADNGADMRAKGRDNPPNRGITHCKHGHEFTPENTYLHARNRSAPRRPCVERVCRTCQAAKTKAWKQNRRAA